MSTTLTLGVVTLQLPLSADVDDTRNVGASYVDTADKNCTLATLETIAHRELATLFAAAPDLLVAAEAVVAADDLLTEDFDRARESYIAALPALRTAIARARGKENT